jgi:ribonuclease HI
MGIHVYTDGSAVASGKNRGLGGLGVVFIVNGGVKKVVSRGYRNTKTGRMELRAALIALKTLRKDQKAKIFSDSMYVVNTFNLGWLENWHLLGYPCKNPDLMKKLYKEISKFPKKNITFHHVKGHSGNIYNELADSLASYKNFKKYEVDMENFY